MVMNTRGEKINVKTEVKVRIEFREPNPREMVVMVVCKESREVVGMDIVRTTKVDSPQLNRMGQAVIPNLQCQRAEESRLSTTHAINISNGGNIIA